MKFINRPCASVALCLFALIICAIWCGTAFAGMSLPGSVRSLGGDSGEKSRSAQGRDAAFARTLKQPVTITHPTKDFRYTIPAGWYIIDSKGDISDDVKDVPAHNPTFGFDKGKCNFSMVIEPMVKSFQRASSVSAMEKQAKEQVEIQKVEKGSVKRRDQGDPKKKCSFIGVQHIEAQRPDPTYNRSMFYRGYDQDNVSYTFGAACKDTAFQACREDFLKIMESIKFCVK